MRYILRRAVAASFTLGLLLCNGAGLADDTGNSAMVRVTYASGETELGTLKTGEKWFTNRDYVFGEVPAEIDGFTFTRRAAEEPADAMLDIPRGETVYLLIEADTKANLKEPGLGDLYRLLGDNGWTRFGQMRNPVTNALWPTIFQRSFSDPMHITIPGAGGAGIIVVAKELKVTSGDKKTGQGSGAVAVATVHTDGLSDNFPTTGPRTRAAILQTSVKCVGIDENSYDPTTSRASQAILTVIPAYFNRLTSVHFGTPVGDQMCWARDDALRYIRLTYPNWNVERRRLRSTTNTSPTMADRSERPSVR